MGLLFGELDAHPLGEAGQALPFEVERHGKIEIRRRELVLDLLAESILHGLVKHRLELPSVVFDSSKSRRVSHRIQRGREFLRPPSELALVMGFGLASNAAGSGFHARCNTQEERTIE
jgi:hypothetical protein